MERLAVNGIGDEGARGLGDALKTNTTLTQLWLGSEQQDRKETQQENKASTTWHVEWLADNGIGVEGARGLVDALKTNTTLTELSLGGEQQDQGRTLKPRKAQQHEVWLIANRIGDEGARALGDALKTNTTLTQLELNSEQQDHKETLKESKSKHNGMWSGWAANVIGDEGARALGDALKTNTTLTQLWLSCEQHGHKITQRERARQAQWHVE